MLWERWRGHSARWRASAKRAAPPAACLRYRLSVAALCAAALLSGCARRPPAAVSDPPPPPPGAAVAAVDPLTVTEQEAGRTVELATGQELIVRLAGNPTTGFGWALPEGAGPLLALLGAAVYEPAAAAPEMVGGGGTEVWRLVARAPGRQELRFVYRRRFEPDVPPALRVSYAVVVR